jgi:capsular exopolysaccharide synthesis family protein
MTKKKKDIKNIVASIQPNSLVAEQFRMIRTNIQFMMVNQDLQTILITSSRPYEGKSTVCVNLATVFGNQGKRVLLVDGDMRLSSIAKMFQLNNQLGLSTLLLTDFYQLDDAVQHIEELNIDILTGGAVPPNPSELLGSERMTKLIEAMKKEYDLVLFDTPPIVTVSDAQVLASKIDGVIMVVRKNIANVDDVYKAKELLDLVEANVIGAVFNGETDIKLNGNAYYY